MRYVRPSQVRNRTLQRAVVIGLTILAIAAITAAAFVLLHKKQQADLNNVGIIKSKVSKLFLLPTDEEPALATVTNSKKLSSSFAGKVENGDKILIYQTNKRAVVYRPGIDKIIDVQAVVIDDVQSLEKK